MDNYTLSKKTTERLSVLAENINTPLEEIVACGMAFIEAYLMMREFGYDQIILQNSLTGETADVSFEVKEK